MPLECNAAIRQTGGYRLSAHEGSAASICPRSPEQRSIRGIAHATCEPEDMAVERMTRNLFVPNCKGSLPGAAWCHEHPGDWFWKRWGADGSALGRKGSYG